MGFHRFIIEAENSVSLINFEFVFVQFGNNFRVKETMKNFFECFGGSKNAGAEPLNPMAVDHCREVVNKALDGHTVSYE